MNWGVFGFGNSGLACFYQPKEKTIYVHVLKGLRSEQREHPQHVFLLFHAKALRLQSQGGVRSQEWNLKKLTEWHHKTWSVRFNLTQHGELYQIRTGWGLSDWLFFLDPLNGGAWPLLVGGVICLVDSVNGRDPSCPVGTRIVFEDSNPPSTCLGGPSSGGSFSAGFLVPRQVRFWATAGLWCSSMFWATRALQCQWEQDFLTFCSDHFDSREVGKHRNHIDPIGTEDCNCWSRNEECLVSAAHQTVLITSLPFVHTARRCFRWWCNTGDRTDRPLACCGSSPIFLQ